MRNEIRKITKQVNEDVDLRSGKVINAFLNVTLWKSSCWFWAEWELNMCEENLNDHFRLKNLNHSHDDSNKSIVCTKKRWWFYFFIFGKSSSERSREKSFLYLYPNDLMPFRVLWVCVFICRTNRLDHLIFNFSSSH